MEFSFHTRRGTRHPKTLGGSQASHRADADVQRGSAFPDLCSPASLLAQPVQGEIKPDSEKLLPLSSTGLALTLLSCRALLSCETHRK